MAKARIPAFAYHRTSGAANVGEGKDSDRRQEEAIQSFARHAGFQIVDTFKDPAVSGADPIDTRPGFRELLERIVGNGTRVVIVEDASRFARQLMVQEAGIATLAGMGVRVLTSRGDDLTDSEDEMRVAMRQIAGVFAQLEKTRLVKKLAGARARKKARGQGRWVGRKAHAELRPEVVELARKLRRANPKTGKRKTFREISKELATKGHRNRDNKAFNPGSIRSMLEGPQRRSSKSIPSFPTP